MKIATKLNANLVQGAGLAVFIASWFQADPLGDILSTLGMVLVYLGLAIHAYVWGRARGYCEGELAAYTDTLTILRDGYTIKAKDAA